MTSKLILLVGKIGCGKTTVANMLKTHGFREEMFASPLKNFAMSIGFKYNEVYGTQEEKLAINKMYNISGREFLQKFGTDLCRNNWSKCIPNMEMNDRTIWVRVMENKIKENKLLVISDGRFEDELSLVKDHNGIIIRILRDCDEDSNSSYKQHESETQMDRMKVDYILDNNGTLEELQSNLEDILFNM